MSQSYAARIRALLLIAVSATGLIGCAIGQARHSWDGIMNQEIVDRFPGAVLLDEKAFASSIVGHRFRYREVGSEIIVERPKEVFLDGGRYELHGSRAISHGTYSLAAGAVLITCPESFLGLDKQRIFFRHRDRLLTANARAGGVVYELILEA